ncbi:MAG: ArpU family phage packaging/lysis transcriptional regulator [Aerococcus sanguinicola]
MRLIPEIDKEKTLDNVDDFLSNYDRYCRLAGSSAQKLTASLSGMPGEGKTNNSSQDTFMRAVKFKDIVISIHQALDNLGVEEKEIIDRKYLKGDLDYWIYKSLNISRATFYRRLDKARLDFAEAYRSGELWVYK